MRSLCDRCRRRQMRRSAPIKKQLIDNAISDFGIQDFAKATIREVKSIAAYAERESGVEFIKMEMGIPGLSASKIGVKAQIEALEKGIANSYPDIQGLPELKQQKPNSERRSIC